MNHLNVTGISICSPLFETPFATVVLNGFLLSSMKGSSLVNWLPFPSFFFWLGVTNNAAKPDCILPTGTMVLCMRVAHPASSSLSKSMKHCSHGSSNCVKNVNTGNHTLISWTMLIGFLYFRETTCQPKCVSHKIWTFYYCVSLFCIVDLHPYSHYHFSKILRPFCASRNWWIIVVFLQSNSLTWRNRRLPSSTRINLEEP